MLRLSNPRKISRKPLGSEGTAENGLRILGPRLRRAFAVPSGVGGTPPPRAARRRWPVTGGKGPGYRGTTGEPGGGRGGASQTGGAGGGTRNAAGDLILPDPAPRWLPPSESPGGARSDPPNCLITLRNTGRKMNLF